MKRTPEKADEWWERPTVTIPEAAELLGIGVSTAYRAARDGEIPVVRVAGRWLVPTAPLGRLLGLEAPSAEPTPAAGAILP
jgi:excisionase family DNA binding protein